MQLSRNKHLLSNNQFITKRKLSIHFYAESFLTCEYFSNQICLNMTLICVSSFFLLTLVLISRRARQWKLQKRIRFTRALTPFLFKTNILLLLLLSLSLTTVNKWVPSSKHSYNLSVCHLGMFCYLFLL